jgi:hypothetical protein
MDKRLFAQAMIKFLAGIISIGVLVFLPAGSFAYWQGWLLMGILFVPMFDGLTVPSRNSQTKDLLSGYPLAARTAIGPN